MKKLNLIGKRYGLLTVLMEGEPYTGMLRNDEIVVYKEEQMTIKYLIEIGN